MQVETQVDPTLFEPLLMLGKVLGLSRSVATVFAIVYSWDAPLTVEEIVDRSGLSKSAVSLALRELLQQGAIQEKMVLGERSRHYIGMADLQQVATEMVMARLRLPLSELRDMVADANSTECRVVQMRALLQTVDSTLASIRAESQS